MAVNRLVAGMLGALACPVFLTIASDRVQAGHSRQAPAAAVATAPSPQRALLDKYCVSCHNQKRPTAELSLQSIDVQNVSAHTEVWERVLRKVRSGEMPPASMPR